MFNISSFLKKFSKNIQSTEIYKKQILDIINKNTQIQISLRDIEIKDCVVKIKSSPAILNKLFIHKSKILEDIKLSLPIKILDIK